ncbi:hypothetical protein HMPREF0322_04930 [Desulfitobacterium hafniense DP7]|uniref:Uncharacterized protein n=1 Tax=Desulfitobacterium hafniense DP7 TaxID=537010 RepID=G9XVB8_DESHA|nr:hypothetical protein HMPREF0322_04930 [Desulfitobacterium hafniense DP7]
MISSGAKSILIDSFQSEFSYPTPAVFPSPAGISSAGTKKTEKRDLSP